MPHYRHEWKHEITYSDLIAIRQRLRAVARPDPHAEGGRYLIRSLYFDTPTDKALREKQSGISQRAKFRIRYYNGDKSVIHLEKKCKSGGLGTKISADLTEEQAQAIVDGRLDWMKESGSELIRELRTRMISEGLAPRTIVDYTREPFIFGPGNVRVTLDYNIRTGLAQTDFLNTELVTVPAAGGICIMEVKWDDYLPDVIRDVVQLPHAATGSFSKYEACRLPTLDPRIGGEY